MSRLEASVVGRAASSIVARRTRDQLLVLAYHGVDDGPLFARQMSELVETRRPVTLAEVIESATTRRPLPPASVLVTFDDGDRTVLDVGLPILARHGVPAALFVIADLIDSDRPFWWNEVSELIGCGASTDLLTGTATDAVRLLKTVPDDRRRHEIELLRSAVPAPVTARQLSAAELLVLEEGGVAIGSHTATHPCLDQCAPEVVADELRRSRSVLGELLGHDVPAFAYPNGNVTADVAAAVDAAGYSVAFGFDHRLSANPPSDPFHISRIRVDSRTDLARFGLLVSGAHSALHHARGRS